MMSIIPPFIQKALHECDVPGVAPGTSWGVIGPAGSGWFINFTVHQIESEGKLDKERQFQVQITSDSEQGTVAFSFINSPELGRKSALGSMSECISLAKATLGDPKTS